MALEPAVKARTLSLPLSVVSLIDLSRLQRELEAVNVFLTQAASREAGKSVTLPKTTRNLEKLCQQNELNLLVVAEREKLTDFLKAVHDKAPRIHISFAADPSAAFIQKIVAWFRDNVNPLTILQVGLQPTIAAGCIVRTTNKYFDLSLRKDFDKHRKLLIDTVRQVRLSAGKTVSATNTPVTPPAPGSEVPTAEYSFVPAPAPVTTAVTSDVAVEPGQHETEPKDV
jgi:F0F1-type ATP synthase delta subunit